MKDLRTEQKDYSSKIPSLVAHINAPNTLPVLQHDRRVLQPRLLIPCQPSPGTESIMICHLDSLATLSVNLFTNILINGD